MRTNELIKRIEAAIEEVDQSIWRDIKRVTGYNDKKQRRDMLLNEIDVLEKVKKKLLTNLKAETTDDR